MFSIWTHAKPTGNTVRDLLSAWRHHRACLTHYSYHFVKHFRPSSGFLYWAWIIRWIKYGSKRELSLGPLFCARKSLILSELAKFNSIRINESRYITKLNANSLAPIVTRYCSKNIITVKQYIILWEWTHAKNAVFWQECRKKEYFWPDLLQNVY